MRPRIHAMRATSAANDLTSKSCSLAHVPTRHGPVSWATCVGCRSPTWAIRRQVDDNVASIRRRAWLCVERRSTPATWQRDSRCGPAPGRWELLRSSSRRRADRPTRWTRSPLPGTDAAQDSTSASALVSSAIRPNLQHRGTPSPTVYNGGRSNRCVHGVRGHFAAEIQSTVEGNLSGTQNPDDELTRIIRDYGGQHREGVRRSVDRSGARRGAGGSIHRRS